MAFMDSLFGLMFGRRNAPPSTSPRETPRPAPRETPSSPPAEPETPVSSAPTSATGRASHQAGPNLQPSQPVVVPETPESTAPPPALPQPMTESPNRAVDDSENQQTASAPAPIPAPIPVPAAAPASGLRDGYLSPHFTLAELTASSVAMRQNIDNRPPPEIVEHLKHTAEHMERVREVLGYPITVTSGYRCLQLNRAIGSTDTSAHVKGYAVDFRCPGFGTPFEIAQKLASSPVMDTCDQLIHEFGEWVHISFDPNSKVSATNKVITIHKLHDGRKVTAGIIALNNGVPT